MSDAKDILEKPCPNCGGTDFEWGFMYRIEFFQTRQGKVPTIIPKGNIHPFQRKSHSTRDVHTRICKACTNLQMFAATPKYKPKP